MSERPLRSVKGSEEAQVPDDVGVAEDEAEGASSLTIDELAREVGMTVRTIRSHQARGLLQPPEVRMRTGYYGSQHAARLRLIQELQAEGFNLTGIRRLIERTGESEQLLGLKRAVTMPFETEQPEMLTQEELASRFGSYASPKALAQAEKLGILVPVGNGRYEAPSPVLLRAAEELMARGVSVFSALSVFEQLERHSEAISRSFVKLFLAEVWRPFQDAGNPESRAPEVIESIERLRPLASDALLSVFQKTMTREVESAFGAELRRLVGRRR